MTTDSAARSRSLSGSRNSARDDVQSLRLWLELMKCSRTIEAAAGSHLRREHGQSLSRFDVLSQLYRTESDWASVGEIAGMVMASSGNITGLLDRMEADGLIERRPSPTDRRGQQIRMTHRGHGLFADMTRDHAAWVDTALDGVSETDKNRLIGLLRRVRHTFDNNAAALSGPAE